MRDGEVAALCVRQLRVCESQARPANRAGDRVGDGHSGRSRVRAAVDVMGGDKAPAAILKGCWEAAPLLDGDDVVFLVGDGDVIAQGLKESGRGDKTNARYRTIATTQTTEKDDSPDDAILNKPD